MSFNENIYFGNFLQNDGTIDFYLRVRTIINENSNVLDYGAGRAKWYEDEECFTRKEIRYLRDDVKVLIAADIDSDVLKNRASHKQVIITKNILEHFEKESFDIIISDYVLEHVEDAENFKSNIDYLLKKGGMFCARTPHKYALVSIFAQLIPNYLHNFVLRFSQPEKKQIDTFDTKFKLNTLKSISKIFNTYQNFSFIYKSNIAYHFNSKIIFNLFKFLNFVLPFGIGDNCFVFLKK